MPRTDTAPECEQRPPSIRFEARRSEAGELVLSFAGRLDAASTADLWRRALSEAAGASARRLVVDASGLGYCDGAGLALLAELARAQARREADFELRGAPRDLERLWSRFDPVRAGLSERAPARPSPVEAAGLALARVLTDLRQLVGFVGTICDLLVRTLLRPRSLRWRDALVVAGKVGADALPILFVVGFLLGLVLAFESATLMKRFGAEIFVANLVGVSLLRELGPLMTAIILAGRSGSAFAAEIGTMKVNEELDALSTMGLDPSRFLVLPRVVAAVVMTPLMSLFTILAGLIGGAVVLISFGFPLIAYVNQVQSAVDLSDLLGGLLKSLALGTLVAGIGCLRGMQTASGATAVGDSTTRAVVSGIVLIAVADGVFSVLYYYLGI